MNFNKLHVVFAMILAVVGSSVAAPVIINIGSKALARAGGRPVVTVIRKTVIIRGGRKVKAQAATIAATKAAAQKVAEEGTKKISKKKIVSGVAVAGATVGTTAWAVNHFNKAGAQPVAAQLN